jgi:hypothetical protein
MYCVSFVATTDMGLFYLHCSNPQLVGYTDTCYLSDSHKGRSQTEYLFTYNNTAISWRSVKQTIFATSSNHSEMIAIHEASRECVWLRSVIQHIQEKCGLSSIKESLTTLYEDNVACITQIRGGYIKIVVNYYNGGFYRTYMFRMDSETLLKFAELFSFTYCNYFIHLQWMISATAY